MDTRMTAVAVAATALVLLVAAPASAHVEREVGPITMTVGFGTEPAYVGQPNSALVILTDHGKPVVDLGDTLQVEVAFGDQTQTLPIVPDFEVGEFGTPGDYRGWFIPSQPGPYTFHFTGTVHGTKIDESFTSGAKTFDEVQDPAQATFPKVDAPSTTDLATRIEQDSARLATAQTALADAQATADSAKQVASLAIVVAAIGVIAAVGAIVVTRRKEGGRS